MSPKRIRPAARFNADKKPGIAAGLFFYSSSFGSVAFQAASSSTPSSAPASSAGLGPRRGPLASAPSISLIASVSVTFCTAAGVGFRS